MKKLAALGALALVVAVSVPVAAASERHPTLSELEGELMCPTCKGETLAESSAPAANRIRHYVARWITAGNTKSQIKARLVAQFGPSILAAPTKHGFDLLAWMLPLAGALGGAVVIAFLARRWVHARDPGAPAAEAAGQNGHPALSPELERRLDEELARFD